MVFLKYILKKKNNQQTTKSIQNYPTNNELIGFDFLRSMLPTYYLESRIDTSGAEPGRAFDTSGAEPGRAFDTSGAEPGRAFDTSGAEPGRAFDTSGAEPGRAFDTSGAEPGRAFDTSGAEPGRAFDTSGAEPGRTFDTSGAEPGRAFDTFGSGPDRQYHGNMNNNNKRLPDIVNQENEFWSQPAQEAFYIPQPPSTLIPALPFTQTDEGLHDLPQDANWLFGDTGTFHFA